MFSSAHNETTGTDESGFDASFTGGGTLGYDLGNQWRLKGEIMCRRNEQSDPVTLNGFGASTDGDFASLALSFSALRDFQLGGDPRWTGYVGAGVSFIQEIDIDFELAGQETSFETDDIGIQLQAGARYAINDRWFADAGVRYLVANSVELELPADASQTLTSDYTPLTFSVGIGVKF